MYARHGRPHHVHLPHFRLRPTPFHLKPRSGTRIPAPPAGTAWPQSLFASADGQCPAVLRSRAWRMLGPALAESERVCRWTWQVGKRDASVSAVFVCAPRDVRVLVCVV